MDKRADPTIAAFCSDLSVSPMHIATMQIESTRGGRAIQYFPWERFNNKLGLDLHSWGEGPFCRFRIPDRYRRQRGVYLFAIEGRIIFCGWCEDLSRRINQHYGTISPRRCFIGGEIENCYINHQIFLSHENGEKVDLYFIQDAPQTLIQEIEDRFLLSWNYDLSHSD